MGVTRLVKELEMELEMGLQESQNQRDKRVEDLWKRLDVQQTGYLDFKGLQRGLRRIDHPLKNADEMLRHMMSRLDDNSDGKIDFDEFRTFVEETEKKLLLLFHTIDRDQNGKLDKAELREAFRKAGLVVPNRKLDAFFNDIDYNNDGYISFGEWRDFLLFMPVHKADAPLAAVLDFYASIVTLSAEGDSMVSEETLEGLGYFVAGALAGGISRTATAPLDRLKVYLLVRTQSSGDTALQALKQGRLLEALRNAGKPIGDGIRDLWRAGGIRSLFAGNGLNVIKIMPESAIKFGSYEAAKRALAKLEGHDDPKRINSYSKFTAGGIAGMVAQFCVYPLDTLKFRLQTSTVQGGLTGNALVIETAKKMWQAGGMRATYRGVTMGLIGMFPYSAIDMGTFELLKNSYKKYMVKYHGIHEEDAKPGNIVTGIIGASSGAFGASVVYPLNVLRTRLQTQGTVMHPATYTGIWDVARTTFRNEGVRGMYKGLAPNLLKVAPALSITWVMYENSKKMLGLE